MKKKFLIVFAVIVAVITVFNLKMSLNSDVDVTTLMAISNDFNGGELPGVSITCETGGSGTCYEVSTKVLGGGYCSLDCIPTGDPEDYCNSFWLGLLELCINLF